LGVCRNGASSQELVVKNMKIECDNWPGLIIAIAVVGFIVGLIVETLTKCN